MTASEPLLAGIAFIVLLLEGAAALLIVSGAVASVAVLVRGRDPARAREAMSQMLLLALDFTIGADILKSVTAPADLSSVAVVAVVVAIRMALTFALQHELTRSDRRRAG